MTSGFDPHDFTEQLRRAREEKDATGAKARSNGHAEPDPTEAELDRLARMSHFQYGRERRQAAKALNLNVTYLDRERDARRAKLRLYNHKVTPQEVADVEPWPQAVTGAVLLGDLVRALKRYVAFTEQKALAAALWAMHAHTLEFAEVAPRLLITSPTPECGKTVLLGVVGQLVPRPEIASNISPAALFRTIEQDRPTLLIDEADAFLAENDELRGLLNSGHTRTSAYTKRIEKIGDSLVPKRFSTWAAICIAGIGRQHPTLMSRCIVLDLQRKLAGDQVDRFVERRSVHLLELSRKIARWVEDNRGDLESAEPVVPEALNNRAYDNWCELLALAELAGGEWPAKAREVALALARPDADDQVRGVQLLEDIRVAFSDRDRMTSDALVSHLTAMEGRPWAEMGRTQKALTKNGLARLLKPFKITPGTIRLENGSTAKGYVRAAFEEAWKRYLLP
jgi:putative DNA primase/helicase